MTPMTLAPVLASTSTPPRPPTTPATTCTATSATSYRRLSLRRSRNWTLATLALLVTAWVVTVLSPWSVIFFPLPYRMGHRSNKAQQYLRNPGKYKSVSAFAPISNPINCPWGQKAFKGYFGEDQQEKWKQHDATELLKGYSGNKSDLKILIDVVSTLVPGCFYKETFSNKNPGNRRQLLQTRPTTPREPGERRHQPRPRQGKLHNPLPARLRPLVLLHVLLRGRPRRPCGQGFAW